MTARAARSVPNGELAAPDLIAVGKDIIELVTSGMYVSPMTVYREYVQNAGDSIDAALGRRLLSDGEGQIEFQFDHAARSVVIRDNGVGITIRDAFKTMLAIGGSPKRGTKARGFRGVGRLSGLAYCKELEFRTKAEGDQSVAVISWDCKALRSRLLDGAYSGDLKSLISESVTLWLEPADATEEHFFQVTMRDVSRHRHDLLLNEQAIERYLAQVAPVAFSPEFEFGPSIQAHLDKHGVNPPVRLIIAGKPIYRPFKNEYVFSNGSPPVRINSVEFFELADVDGEVGAVGWLGHHDYTRSIPQNLDIRGLRARSGNVQIGEDDLFQDTFREERFNGWAIGEVSILDRRVIPNGRRDNFELNHHAYNLIAQLQPITLAISNRCRTESVARNIVTIARNTCDTTRTRLELGNLSGAEISSLRAAIQRAQAKLAKIKATEQSAGELSATLASLDLELMNLRPQAQQSVLVLDEALSIVSRIVTNREQARRLIEALRQVCS
jgi:molecular chaperone HtpG